MPSATQTPSLAWARSSVALHESIPEPTEMTRWTPASLARVRTCSGGSAHASRCACVSVMGSSRGCRQVDTRKERSRRLDSLCRGRLPVGDLLQREVDRLAERTENPRRRLWQVRRKGDCDRSQPVAQVVEDRVELLGVCLVLGELPRGRLLDVAIQPADDLPDIF